MKAETVRRTEQTLQAAEVEYELRFGMGSAAEVIIR